MLPLQGWRQALFSRFRDEEAGRLETPAQGPKIGEAGFSLVSVPPEPPLWALVFSCFLLKCRNNCQS